ncbi:MAG: hypothetical protein M1514_00595, partial [Patescibacteria group bacterium]|nr:hypothetical protein [Patescibacteria group bacterium]
MLSDLGQIFIWWLTILITGLAFLPLTKKIFARFFDKGYLFAKVLGIMVSSYLVWLFASLKILPFYRETILLVMVIGLIANLLIQKVLTPTTHPRPFDSAQGKPTFHLSQ